MKKDITQDQYEKKEKEAIPKIEKIFKVKYLYFNNAVDLYYFKRAENVFNKLDTNSNLLSLSFKEMTTIPKAIK